MIIEKHRVAVGRMIIRLEDILWRMSVENLDRGDDSDYRRTEQAVKQLHRRLEGLR